MRVVGVFAAIVASVLICRGQPKVEGREWGESHIFELNKSEFDRSRIIKEASAIVKSRLNERLWGSWYWGIKGKQAAAYPSKPTNHSDHEWWMQYLSDGVKSGELPIRELAELNVVGKNAVLRMVLNGRQEVLVLSGKNPLILSSLGGRCEIVEYTIPNRCFGSHVEPSRETSLENDGCVSYSVTICLKCTNLAKTTLIADATKKLLSSLPPNISVTLAIREDEYFYDVPLFPVLAAFTLNPALDLKKLQMLGRRRSKVMILNSTSN